MLNILSLKEEIQMATFGEFVEGKRVNGLIVECANLMAEMDVEPNQYIYESLKRVDPDLAENWWQGVSNFATNVGQGVKQFFSNVGQGAKAGYKQAADTIAGPVAKFDAAERALQSLVDVLRDERFKDFKSSAKHTKGASVAEYIDRVLASLRVDKQAVPQLMQTQVNQNYGTRGQVQDQQQQQAQPQQQQAPAQPLSAAAPARQPKMKMADAG
jgi:hypothetical protein